jgi:heat shock protein HslJ
MADPNALGLAMKSLVAVVAALVTFACATSDPNLPPGSGAPSYVPSNAMPPTLSAAANDLGLPTWQWQRTQLADGRTIVAAAPERYTLKFEGGGRVLLRADCNRGSGSYEVNGNSMKLGPAALTKMGCPAGSQDNEFAQALPRVASYAIDGGQLVLTLAGGGTMTLRAVP